MIFFPLTGGVAGGLIGIVAVACITFFFFRRRGYAAVSKQHHVNVLQDDEDGNASPSQDLPQYFTPEPYLVPDPTIGGTSEAGSTRDRPLSAATSDTPRPLTPLSMTTAATRKSAAFGQLRPVNIIQHDDAGPSEGPASPGEPETIELPPAYTNIRTSQRSPGPATDAATISTSPPETTS